MQQIFQNEKQASAIQLEQEVVRGVFEIRCDATVDVLQNKKRDPCSRIYTLLKSANVYLFKEKDTFVIRTLDHLT